MVQMMMAFMKQKIYCVHNRTRLEIRSYECIDLSLTEWHACYTLVKAVLGAKIMIMSWILWSVDQLSLSSWSSLLVLPLLKTCFLGQDLWAKTFKQKHANPAIINYKTQVGHKY